jgi:hypothetical protein
MSIPPRIGDMLGIGDGGRDAEPLDVGKGKGEGCEGPIVMPGIGASVVAAEGIIGGGDLTPCASVRHGKAAPTSATARAATYEARARDTLGRVLSAAQAYYGL